MDSERWARIEEIFLAALDLPIEARSDLVNRQCAGDEDLRREVEKLIERDERENSFLESPVWTDSQILQSEIKKEFALSLEDEIASDDAGKSYLGRRVGVFELVDEIGKGGMGVVYLGERADGEFRQRAAIKLIKRGMDTDFIVRRFRHERQILAALNHPNIAHLLDGGTTKDDSPYFAMEYVEGEPLFKFCRENDLDIRRRLKIFREICQAISYAHSKGIVHRDIKPGNILVAADGVPKLLDFGIAKILDEDLIHESIIPTATQMRLMTPEYASPEQVRGEEITPASDQYSLGVLLYELITGVRPYKFPSRSPHEIARVICEEIPSEPSNGNFGKTPTGDFSFDKDFCEKLDCIVLKSLKKNPAERYASVKDFADDIERFLRGEQIRAASSPEISEATRKKSDSTLTEPQIGQKSIAVLPFKNLNALSGEQAESGDYLNVGLADALIIRLSNVREFVVRPTSSVLRYAAPDSDSFAAGNDLKVAFVLDGNILKTGKRLRVSVQLLNIAEKSTFWAERFDEDLTDVLTLEDSISKRVTESLVPQLAPGDAQVLAHRPTNNAAAYEAFMRGRVFWNTFTKDGMRRAVTFYEEAIRLDPNYAQAHAAIADYYVWLGMSCFMPTKEFYPLAKEAISRAIELDPNSSEAYAARGLLEVYGGFDWTESEKSLNRAVELNPHNAVAHNWFFHPLFTRGDFATGRIHLRRALELDPTAFQNQNSYAWSLYFERRFDEAEARAGELIEKFPQAAYAYFAKSAFLRVQGKTKEAVHFARRAAALSDDGLFTYFGLGAALAANGERKEAQNIIRHPPAGYSSHYHTAEIYCYLKDREKAFAFLEKAFVDKEVPLVWLAIEPGFDLLRDDPRYFALLEKLNHPLAKPKNPSMPVKSKGAITSGKSTMPADSEAETIIQPTETAATATRRIPAALKYALAAVGVIIGGWFIYYFVSHLKLNSSFVVSQGDTNGNWREAFASKMSVSRLNVSGKVKSAAVAPDGKSAAYISEENGRQKVWLKSLDANDARPLAETGATDFHGIVFAPDGQAVYYLSSNFDGSFNELFRVSLAGDAVSQKVGEVGDEIAFAPDGKRIACYGYDPKARVRTVDIAELDENFHLKTPVQLAARKMPNYYYGVPVFSPGGEKIAAVFGAGDDGDRTSQMIVINLSDNREEIVSSGVFTDISAFVWRTDSEIVASATKAAQSFRQLWLINYPSGETAPLTDDLSNYSGVSLSKDAATMLSVRRETSSNIEIVNLNEKSDTLLKQITDGSDRRDGIKGLQWTADNKILYVGGRRGAETALTMIDENGANAQTIVPGNLHPVFPMLSSDRRVLFFTDETKENLGLWRSDLNGGNLKRLTTEETILPSLSPDNRFVIYSLIDQNKKMTLHRIPAEGGEPTQLTSDFCARAVVSPDNKLIAAYYSSAETGGAWKLAVLNANGGVPLRIVDLPKDIDLQFANETSLAWSADSRALYYLNGHGGVSNIFRVSITDNRQNEQLTHFSTGKIFAFAVSPDEKRAALARGSTSSDIVIFKNSR